MLDRFIPYLSFAGGVFVWACGSSVETNPVTGATSGGSGGASTSTVASSAASTATASSGSGGLAATTVGAGGATSSATTGVGGSGDPCANAFISITLEPPNDPPRGAILTGVCGWGSGETTHAVAYEGYTSEGSGTKVLFLEGCDPSGPPQLRMTVPLLGVGSAMTETFSFQLSGVSFQTTNGLSVTVTSLGPLHALVEGNYSGTVLDSSGQAHAATGAFSLCHVSDFLPP